MHPGVQVSDADGARSVVSAPDARRAAVRIGVVEGFCRTVTGDHIPWHFALHLELNKKNDPDWNPHTHIIFRDRTGATVTRRY